jgi:hypothetical protein
MKAYIVLQPRPSGAILCHVRGKIAFAKQIRDKYEGSYIKNVVEDELSQEEMRAFTSYCAFGTQNPNDIDGAARAAKQIIAQLKSNAQQTQ